MTLLDMIMPRIVALMAIRNWRDLLAKSLFFYMFFLLLSLPFVFAETGDFSWSDFWADAGLTMVVATPVIMIKFLVVSYLDRLHRQLAQLALTDMLTGLPNRRQFFDRAADRLLTQDTSTLVILDADHFKRINDTYGHAVGDACLEAVGERLRAVRQSGELVARIGGEEFAAFLPNASEARLHEFAAQMTRPIVIDDKSLTEEKVELTLSLGAAHGDTGHSLIGLMQRADAALYHAKANGRGHLEVWHPDHDLDAQPAPR